MYSSDKNIHLTAAGLCLAVSVLLLWFFCDLRKDVVTTFGTIGSCVTIYGVIFAIIELRRAKAASLMAQEAATKVFETVTGLITAREITECQAVIHAAVCSIDEGKAIPSALLQQVIRLYSQIFHSEVAKEDTPHRKCRSVIQSYSFNPNTTTKASSSRRTRQALLSITGHPAMLQGTTKTNKV